ncbi:MAG TPA: peptidylprolyl isomerase [Gaiellaceae bacterium]|nr:peptidylprolyl isomerase [Gaiellaceae bacterium]
MRSSFLVLALLLATAGCGGDEEAGGDGGCERVEAPPAREAPELELPRGTLDPSRSYALVFATSCGDFTVDLDLRLAPETTASLVFLARQGFYDDTVFHRIVPGFVVQGGDPTQTGGGGPGYATLDRPPTSVRYTKGTVAMAKTAIAPAGTAGSQFFVVTAEDAGLPPEYAIVGRVSEGMDTVERIEALGGADERPTRPVVLRSVTVAEG